MNVILRQLSLFQWISSSGNEIEKKIREKLSLK